MLFPQKTGNKLKRPTFEYQDNRFFTAGGSIAAIWLAQYHNNNAEQY
jgi:hypothetical protein